MGLFRNAMDFFRGRAGKRREVGAAELRKGEDGAAEPLQQEEGAAEPLEGDDGAAEPLKMQARTVMAQSVVAGREVKREARPDPNKPGWGRNIGSEIGKARGDRASQE